MARKKTLPGHFSVLYFAAASSIAGKTEEDLPAPLAASELYKKLEELYPGMKAKVLDSAALTINLEYVDLSEAADGGLMIKEGDEVAIIPPVSSG